MYDISTVSDLDNLLNGLRTAGTDHQWIEAKRAKGGHPNDLWTTLIAFVNSDVGGLALLGVDESSNFQVTGLDDPAAIQEAFQANCSSLEPPLRPVIRLIEHPQGVVLAAAIQPIPRNQRPCHNPDRGIYASSYIRVGDGDELMTEAEVDDLQANRVGADYSLRPANEAALLSDALVEQLLSAARTNTRYADLPKDVLLERLGVVTSSGEATIAGVLVVGENPEQVSGAGRVGIRQLPDARAPEDTRFSSTHEDGTVGELLDAVMRSLEVRLGTFQVSRGGRVFEELDVPREALREIVANALIHRSLTPAQESSSIAIEVGEDVISVTSPGGIHVNADPSRLGLEPLSQVRNLTLVRLGELARTPSGARIVENQASGIAAADRAAREANAAPPLFLARPARFTALMIRGPLPRPGTELPDGTLTEDQLRVLSFAHRLEHLQRDDPGGSLAQIRLDSSLAARLLAPGRREDALAVLNHLVSENALLKVPSPAGTVWRVAEGPPPASEQLVEGKRMSPADRIQQLLVTLLSSQAGEMTAKEIQESFGVKSNKTVSRTINSALEKQLVEGTTESPHDPNRAYRLTETGRQAAKRKS